MMNDNDNIDICTYSRKWKSISESLQRNQKQIIDYHGRRNDKERLSSGSQATQLLQSGLQAAIADLGVEISSQQAEERAADERLARLGEIEAKLAEEVRSCVHLLGKTQEELHECQRDGLRTRDHLRGMRVKTTTLKSEVKDAVEQRKNIALQHKAMSVLFGRLTGVMKVDVVDDDRSTIQLELARGRGSLYVPMRSDQAGPNTDELWEELLQVYELDNSNILASLSEHMPAVVSNDGPPPAKIEKNRESIIF